ncbi:MAG: hypothetical protein WB987_14670 [Candidatus Acidiferrales bacterium]
MFSNQNAEVQLTAPMPTTLWLRKHTAVLYRLVSWLFTRKAVSEAVATRVRFNASPEAVWNHIMLYEEVPGRPPFLLRALLPHPVRTEGVKTRVGATVRCVYEGGDLVKRITTVDPPRFLEFEVVEQRLGIEDCILTVGGSYEIYTCGDATHVMLITNYQAYLRPRYLWRALEALLVRQLHRHILRGVCAEVLHRNPVVRPFLAESLPSRNPPPGGLTCTASQSRFRR